MKHDEDKMISRETKFELLNQREKKTFSIFYTEYQFKRQKEWDQ